jgi:selenocysteine-specific elongation factor
MKSIVIGTAGHIDHGKSALVRALTGTDPDRLKEEQARGITIDLGFAHLQTEGVNLAFVDVPGHERFVKNMLAGAGGIDLVMLIVAADESVMPQTREHFQICRLLRVPAGVIALTKSDLVDRETRELARLETRELVAGSFLSGAPIIAVSSKTGEGLAELRHALVTLARTSRQRGLDGPARLPIDRVFSVKGFGTVVTGTLVSGVVNQDDVLQVLPRGAAVKVRGLQVHGRKELRAEAGHRLAVNLGGVEIADLGRGDTLATPGAFEVTRRVDAALDLIPEAAALRHGARVRFHQGTTELLGRVAIGAPRRAEGTAAEIPPGRSAYVRIRLEAPAVLTRGDRFIVRAYSPPVTIGGGTVLDPLPPRSAIRTAAARARFQMLDPEGDPASDADKAVFAFIEERGAAGVSRASLGTRGGLSGDAATRVVERLTSNRRTTKVGDLLVSSALLEELSAQLLSALRAHHGAQPLSDGMPREEARERIFGRAAPAVFEHVVEDLASQRRIVATDRLALASHRVSLSPEETRASETIEQLFRNAGLAPPDEMTVVAAAKVPAAVVDRVARLLVRQKRLVKIDTLLFHADALAQLKADVRGMKGRSGVDVPAFKERYGITRKYAIPLLEYLDRERVTRRVGNSRVVL